MAPVVTRPAEARRLEIRRPAELVELAELVYRGVFGVGLVVATGTAGYALLLVALQSGGHRGVSVGVCVAVLIGELVAVRHRVAVYRALRLRPPLVLLPAVGFAVGCGLMGVHNQQMFYALTLLFGVLSVAVPLRWTAVAAVIAAIGLGLPRALDGNWLNADVIAAVVIPVVFWLIIEQLARYMLRLHHALTVDPVDPPPVRVQAWTTPDPPDAVAGAQSGDDLRRAAVDDAEHDADSEAPNLDDAGLNSRQMEVIALRCEGLTDLEIAACLQMGPQQIRRHLRVARDRVGVRTTPQLVAWAIRVGLVPPP
ncbi:helix-turn-helix transcriptional regulator [Patulibacter sp. NPDC049589]|uniref:helix-turn-helix transcriptional regulator n=1 Tax=Patulibacter sp. NPDC049589 TaxID=3154731 RepID=UPI0034209488